MISSWNNVTLQNWVATPLGCKYQHVTASSAPAKSYNRTEEEINFSSSLRLFYLLFVRLWYYEGFFFLAKSYLRTWIKLSSLRTCRSLPLTSKTCVDGSTSSGIELRSLNLIPQQSRILKKKCRHEPHFFMKIFSSLFDSKYSNKIAKYIGHWLLVLDLISLPPVNTFNCLLSMFPDTDARLKW